MPKPAKTSAPHTARWRRRLTGLTLIFAASLLGLLMVAVRLGSEIGQSVPSLFILPGRTITPRGVATTGDSSVTNVASTQPFGNEPGSWGLNTPDPTPTVTPSVYWAFLPNVVELALTPTPPVAVQFEIPPPAPNWPDALPGLASSKLGVHVIRNNDPYIMEFVRRVHPRVMKAVDDVGWLSDVKAASPETVTIGRFSGQDESWAGTLDPAGAAQTYIATFLERYRLNPGVDYWEGWNEYDPNDDAKLQWYAQFEAARACQMRDLGLRAAVGGFAYGVPEYYEMGLFLPALEAAHQCGAIFTLHEGISTRLNCGIGVNDASAAIPGAPLFPNVTLGYHMLRYRFWYEGYLKPRGLGDLPLVISELAIAPDSQCGGSGGAGWKDYTDWWVREGVGPDGPQAYVNLLAGYDSEIRKDSYVWGVTIFTAGAVGDTGWGTFDLHDAFVPLAFYEVGLPPATPIPSYP